MRAVLITALALVLVLPAVAPVASAGVPEPICWTLCAVLFAIAQLLAGCANEEAGRVQGTDDGCVFVNAIRDGATCSVEEVKERVGAGPGCPAT